MYKTIYKNQKNKDIAKKYLKKNQECDKLI